MRVSSILTGAMLCVFCLLIGCSPTPQPIVDTEPIGDGLRELTPENTAAFCVRFQGQNQGTRHERKETQDRGNYSYSADG